MSQYLKLIFLALIFSVAGYLVGVKSSKKIIDMSTPESWKGLNTELSGKILTMALRYGDWSALTQNEARKSLGAHIDASKVPHGDLVVPGKAVHSGRYQISQWQRVATGTGIVVFSRDKKGGLYVALGEQRGKLVYPQGYMEATLPKDDLTGLRAQGASRINGTTGELIPADHNWEDHAVREVKKELGVNINKKDLTLLGALSASDANPVVPSVVGWYGTILSGSMPKLRTLDTEFADDAMKNPFWAQLSDINCSNSECYVSNKNLPLDPSTISIIQKGLVKLLTECEQKDYTNFLAHKPFSTQSYFCK